MIACHAKMTGFQSSPLWSRIVYTPEARLHCYTRLTTRPTVPVCLKKWHPIRSPILLSAG